jgi:arabinofuranosyltransferase
VNGREAVVASHEEEKKGGVHHWLPRLLLAAVVAGIAFVGWRALFFFTDDAFIAFRYAANVISGHGLTWNPPPFQAVEGYTSALWVALLALVWQATGVEPPDSSNILSLVFGCATLLVTYRFAVRMRLPEALDRHRFALLGLVLLGTVSNRTFLTWLSSGLETALFNFCFTWWLYRALAPREDRGQGWVFGLSLSAGSAALARPDGVLCVLGSVVILVCDRLEGRDRPQRALRWLLACAPLLIVPAHTLWRRFTYGEWLPNTYYAKHIAAWPESGLRYAASFALEYGVWVWLLIALAWVGAALASLARTRKVRIQDYAGVVAVGVVVAHAAYYTLIIGGDHFEYRVYSHLIPLLFLSALWMSSRLSSPGRTGPRPGT